MKMSKLEKKFVNSKKHAQRNIRVVEQIFDKVELGDVSDALEVGCGAGIVAAHLSEKYNVRVAGTDVDSDQIYLYPGIYIHTVSDDPNHLSPPGDNYRTKTSTVNFYDNRPVESVYVGINIYNSYGTPYLVIAPDEFTGDDINTILCEVENNAPDGVYYYSHTTTKGTYDSFNSVSKYLIFLPEYYPSVPFRQMSVQRNRLFSHYIQ